MRPLYAAVTQPEEVAAFGVQPGVSSFARNISGLDLYMQELLRKAEDGLGYLREQWYLIPIYFKATAGARDLYNDQRDAIFDKIRENLFACKFRFDSEYWARTISGEEEAVHAWLTVNSMTGTFRAENAGNTWGALDMGGASVQMAFIPKDVSILQNYYPLRLSYLNIHIYSHSFLEFGYRDAHIRAVRQLVAWQNTTGSKDDPVRHPCVPAGLFYALPFTEPFAAKEGEVRWVRGTGDFAACRNISETLLHTDVRCFVPATSRKFATGVSQKHGACGINGVYEPSLEGRNFMAIGQYAKLAELIGVPLNKPVALAEMLPGMMRICAQDRVFSFVPIIDDPDSTLRMNGVRFKDPMSLPLSRCWKVVWMFSVLHKGLRFPLDVPQITFAKQLNGRKTGWALGAMMHEVNYYPWMSPSSGSPGGMVAEAATLDVPPRSPWLELSGAPALFMMMLVGAALGLGLSVGWWARGRRLQKVPFGYEQHLLV